MASGGVGTNSQAWKSHPTQDSSGSFEFYPPSPYTLRKPASFSPSDEGQRMTQAPQKEENTDTPPQTHDTQSQGLGAQAGASSPAASISVTMREEKHEFPRGRRKLPWIPAPILRGGSVGSQGLYPATAMALHLRHSGPSPDATGTGPGSSVLTPQLPIRARHPPPSPPPVSPIKVPLPGAPRRLCRVSYIHSEDPVQGGPLVPALRTPPRPLAPCLGRRPPPKSEAPRRVKHAESGAAAPGSARGPRSLLSAGFPVGSP